MLNGRWYFYRLKMLYKILQSPLISNIINCFRDKFENIHKVRVEWINFGFLRNAIIINEVRKNSSTTTIIYTMMC